MKNNTLDIDKIAVIKDIIFEATLLGNPLPETLAHLRFDLGFSKEEIMTALIEVMG